MPLPEDKNGNIIQGVLEPKAAQKVALTVASARSGTDFAARVIRVVSDVDCFIRLGDANVTATVNDHFLPAKSGDYFAVGGAKRVAGIVAIGAGNLYVTELE